MIGVSQTTWLLLGAAIGYGLMMWTNPVRTCLRDGWRVVTRYPVLWWVLGTCGFAHAVFSLGSRFYLSVVLPMEDRPVFMWAREAWRDPRTWFTGTPQSLWWLPWDQFTSTVRESGLTSLESLAGLFDNLVSAFPLAIVAVPVLLMGWRGRGLVLRQALRNRYGRGAHWIYAGLALTGLCCVAKPALFLSPAWLPLEWWLHWSQVVAAAAHAFEYLAGVGAQVFLLLVAYAWIRGLNFAQSALIDVAIRRFACVLPWSALVLLLSGVLIEAPLILKNFPSTAAFFPESELFARRLAMARAALALVIVAGASLQVSLALHASTLRRAWTQHLDLVRRAWWPLSWFVIIAGFHFLAVHAVGENVARGFGEGTALWVAWRLITPWIFAAVGAWLLASWVCVYQYIGRGEPTAQIFADA